MQGPHVPHSGGQGYESASSRQARASSWSGALQARSFQDVIVAFRPWPGGPTDASNEVPCGNTSTKPSRSESSDRPVQPSLCRALPV